mmetsp:Transcript_6438/g.20246  ORF Transcript_6438/g.20246 Transcript_6438/m.20246 type:complete len:412 (-) Transcript_6438:22-1257(-)
MLFSAADERGGSSEWARGGLPSPPAAAASLALAAADATLIRRRTKLPPAPFFPELVLPVPDRVRVAPSTATYPRIASAERAAGSISSSTALSSDAPADSLWLPRGAGSTGSAMARIRAQNSGKVMAGSLSGVGFFLVGFSGTGGFAVVTPSAMNSARAAHALCNTSAVTEDSCNSSVTKAAATLREPGYTALHAAAINDFARSSRRVAGAAPVAASQAPGGRVAKRRNASPHAARNCGGTSALSTVAMSTGRSPAAMSQGQKTALRRLRIAASTQSSASKSGACSGRTTTSGALTAATHRDMLWSSPLDLAFLAASFARSFSSPDVSFADSVGGASSIALARAARSERNAPSSSDCHVGGFGPDDDDLPFVSFDRRGLVGAGNAEAFSDGSSADDGVMQAVKKLSGALAQQ